MTTAKDQPREVTTNASNDQPLDSKPLDSKTSNDLRSSEGGFLGSPTLEDTDTARLRALIHAHASFVRSLLRGAGVPDSDADDVLQRTFWTVAKRLSDVRVGSERAFLRSVALRQAGHLRRSRSTDREVLDLEAFEVTTESVRQDELVRRRQAYQVAVGVLHSMDGKLRPVFELFELEGCTIEEVAERLKIPAGTVKTRLRRARREFYSLLSQQREPDSQLGNQRGNR